MPLNPKKEQLSKASLELEKTNRMTENVTDEELKESMVFKMDKLNKKLEVLEKESGLSQKQIMENYQKLSEKIVIENIRDLIHEFDSQIKSEILKDITKGEINSLIKYVRKLKPQRLVMATSVALLLSINAMVIAPGSTSASSSIDEWKKSEMVDDLTDEVADLIFQKMKEMGLLSNVDPNDYSGRSYSGLELIDLTHDPYITGKINSMMLPKYISDIRVPDDVLKSALKEKGIIK